MRQVEPSYRTTTQSGTPVWVTGTGPTIVLVHGVLMDHRMWDAQVAALSTRYRVCCIDMLGHGDAPSPPGERTLGDFVVQVDEVIDAFSDEGRPVLGGFSMGGLITQAYGVAHCEKVQGLIIMNAVYARSPEESAIVASRSADMRAGGAAAALASARERWFERSDFSTREQLVKNILAWMDEGDFASKVKAHRVFSIGDAEIAGKLGVISCPSLVMTGELDGGSTPAMARRIAEAIPDAKLKILDGQRHMMPVLDAARVNMVLLDFLSTCTSPGD